MVVLRAGGREQGSGCWAQGAGHRAQGAGHRAQNLVLLTPCLVLLGSSSQTQALGVPLR